MDEDHIPWLYVNYAQIVYISLYLAGLGQTWDTDQKVRMEGRKAENSYSQFWKQKNKEQQQAYQIF